MAVRYDGGDDRRVLTASRDAVIMSRRMLAEAELNAVAFDDTIRRGRQVVRDSSAVLMHPTSDPTGVIGAQLTDAEAG